MWFMHEIKQLEQLVHYPLHPNLVRYYGCRVRNARITGTLLGRRDELWVYLQAGKTVDKDPFLAALASAVDHLYNAISLVYNDIHPGNIIISPVGVPTLANIGVAYPDREEITQDLAALTQLRTWLDNPVDPWTTTFSRQ
ncbi:hypothetical protein B0T25DRAFT_586173 [Lasiosphaeria hispida]|uniref:Protein kinase domain-containing protein n=1 Tax=Lasiosphaeria hispida TaxID=260671 RepID=A0AAJ0M8T5_9PEZI|nr:hypothetical protein B0T25DRAFT_586173 [Lasiosphaeria hispida]